jgi:hypothetical protein
VKIDYFKTLQQLGFLRIGENGINTPLMLIWSNVRFGLQKRKYSLRADVFRFTPGNGHPACGLGCPFRANIGSRLTHSIASSARATIDRATIRSSGFAAFRLTTN